MSKSVFRAAALVFCLFAAAITLCTQGLAQDAAPQTAAEAPAQPQEETAPADIAPATMQSLIDDPAVKEALEARDAADKALAEAVRSAAAKAEDQSGADAADGAPKKSIIPKNAEEVKALGSKIWDKVLGWLTSIPFLAQVGAIVLAFFMAPLLAGSVKKRVFLFRDPPADGVKLKLVRDYIYRSGVFLRAIWMVALLALFAVILKNVPVAGADWLVKLAQGLAVVFLLYSAIKTFAPNDLIRSIATWVLIPISLLIVFGYLDDLTGFLNNMKFGEGEKALSAMTLVKLAIFGVVFFKLGNVSNAKGQSAIRSQESLDSATREVVAKIFQIIVFAIMVILVFTAAGISLSGLVVIMSALSLGIGLGLQPIAANFVSGLIILFDRSVKIGDFVVLPDGQEGFVDAINMRSTTVETTDGKDIMVPNTKFTEEAYENWTHKDPGQRYEVEFCVAYDTDLDALEDIIMPKIMEYPDLLTVPELPDLEFRSFGTNGINMAIEFWCEGIDDGPNKFTSDIGFIIWRTLKANKIEMPLPQRVVYTKK